MAQLIFQTAFIGDALLSIPLVKSLKELYPQEKIEIVCRPLVADLFRRLNFVDEAHSLDKTKPESWSHLKSTLKSRQYQSVFCPHESFTSAKFVYGLDAKLKVGYKNWWNFWFFDERVERPMQYPEALRQLFLLPPFAEKLALNHGLENSDSQDTYNAESQPVPSWADMKLELKESEVLAKKSEYGLPESYVCMAPGSVWETKKWGTQKYRELCEKLVEQGRAVVVAGSPAENELCAEVIKGLPGTYNLAGNTDLYDMIHVLKRADCLVSNDSGTMHLAAAAGTPTVSIFGPTTLKLGYRPWQTEAKVVQAPLKCRPCGLHGHNKCPIGTHECMKNIAVQEVYDLIKL